MFASIGVRIDWRERDSCPVGVGAIQVRLSYDSTSMRHDRAERGTKRNQDMTTFTIDNQHSLTVLDPPQMHAPLTLIETLPPLACLHCASTQAYVRRERAIADALLGYASNCVCCDPETGNACPRCGSTNLEYGTYDFGSDSETGYADAGGHYRCLDCGSYRRPGRHRRRPGDTGSAGAQAHDVCDFCGAVCRKWRDVRQ